MPLSRSTPSRVQPPSYGYGYGLLAVILIISLTAVFWWQLPPQIPMFYSLPYGVNQLADKVWFLLFPGLALGIWVGYVLVTRWATRSTIYAPLMKWLHLLTLFLLFIAMIHILLVTI